ncbi:nuclear transport factor 2 family protein [Endozoicomonas arenosclerae]|uniref:nuclear transport factor 2 family protein n=1 Tax=Endozoicomonas arenosclerae TaxID=1633495 RepID=UPI000783084D|nr:nuclear transport factor 2 family protein [Endozoicomonas arenosclerae]
MTPQDLLLRYEQVLASQDWEKIAPLMHKDICVTFSNGTYKGIEAVESVFIDNFTSIKEEDYRITNVHWAYISENTAVCLYDFNWKGIIDGEECSGGGRGTSSLIREQDQWLIISEHLGPYSS